MCLCTNPKDCWAKLQAELGTSRKGPKTEIRNVDGEEYVTLSASEGMAKLTEEILASGGAPITDAATTLARLTDTSKYTGTLMVTGWGPRDALMWSRVTPRSCVRLLIGRRLAFGGCWTVILVVR
jgi:hypothetical protein